MQNSFQHPASPAQAAARDAGRHAHPAAPPTHRHAELVSASSKLRSSGGAQRRGLARPLRAPAISARTSSKENPTRSRRDAERDVPQSRPPDAGPRLNRAGAAGPPPSPGNRDRSHPHPSPLTFTLHHTHPSPPHIVMLNSFQHPVSSALAVARNAGVGRALSAPPRLRANLFQRKSHAEPQRRGEKRAAKPFPRRWPAPESGRCNWPPAFAGEQG